MGNVDTKMNFRKAIVQLGTKKQVKIKHHSTFNSFKYLWKKTTTIASFHLRVYDDTVNNKKFYRFFSPFKCGNSADEEMF